MHVPQTVAFAKVLTRLYMPRPKLRGKPLTCVSCVSTIHRLLSTVSRARPVCLPPPFLRSRSLCVVSVLAARECTRSEAEALVEGGERAVDAAEAVAQLLLGDDERRRGVQQRRAQQAEDALAVERRLEGRRFATFCFVARYS